jgi:hypothetical protein
MNDYLENIVEGFATHKGVMQIQTEYEKIVSELGNIDGSEVVACVLIACRRLDVEVTIPEDNSPVPVIEFC